MSQVDGPYPHAPVVEAGLTLAFEDGKVFDVHELERRFDEQFPDWKTQGIYKVSDTFVPMSVPPEGALGDRSTLVGFQRSNDRERVRFIEDEIRYVRVYDKGSDDQNYRDWDAFIGQAMGHLVPLVADVAGETVTYAQARFVNELPIPQDRDYEIRDWVRLAVDVPGRLPQDINRMFTQVDIPFNREDTGIVNTRNTVFAGVREGEAILVLDIEVSKEFAHRNVNGLEDILGVLRSVKNELFEGAITDACRIRMGGELK
ncbi:TIGR04255 family protein [Microbacterium maritypicum]|uniref:TIGR04255 family protein n=1 Tax=Microbacterium maritypicum TaxID=33918 RepID=A0A4Y4B5H2_MICMQ|nr:TIGR04255 family protein [Microbacterium liquefaciens]GEC74194.1 hypothetical protein MLI01_03390 [Microbacterium liquefaciens]GGV49561.1 hypothetical protein GCM10010213_03400 [Microbacterium liquefaciens]